VLLLYPRNLVVRDASGNRSFEDPMPGKMVEPGLVMFWFGADLFFANVTFFVEQARKLVHDSPSPFRWLVIDAPAITGLDFSTGRAVAELQQDHSRLDVDFRSGVCGALGTCWQFRAAGSFELLHAVRM